MHVRGARGGSRPPWRRDGKGREGAQVPAAPGTRAAGAPAGERCPVLPSQRPSASRAGSCRGPRRGCRGGNWGPGRWSAWPARGTRLRGSAGAAGPAGRSEQCPSVPRAAKASTSAYQEFPKLPGECFWGDECLPLESTSVSSNCSTDLCHFFFLSLQMVFIVCLYLRFPEWLDSRLGHNKLSAVECLT